MPSCPKKMKYITRSRSPEKLKLEKIGALSTAGMNRKVPRPPASRKTGPR
jgi:hypothetical protein